MYNSQNAVNYLVCNTDTLLLSNSHTSGSVTLVADVSPEALLSLQGIGETFDSDCTRPAIALKSLDGSLLLLSLDSSHSLDFFLVFFAFFF